MTEAAARARVNEETMIGRSVSESIRKSHDDSQGYRKSSKLQGQSFIPLYRPCALV